ncbi:MAG: MBL fold metallo-hydrolase, partial [Desulfarculus sp.]|nr:MBL fold metallo-hydrolase [Pseudomonadota bacterium]MBV1751351.1 MBL fold metallo-hydrolase [Desulfarculus sp.]
MSTYKIHPVVVGLNATDQGIMTYMRGYGQAIHIPIYVFYLEGGGQKILIDTGLEDFIIPEGLEEELGLKAEYFEDGLERLGVKPEDIDIIIHTHLHNDHCENDALCTKAKVYAQRGEIEFMQNPHPLDHRYDPDY